MYIKTQYDKTQTICSISILIFSLIDTFMTLNVINNGGSELNPFMEMAINNGEVNFIIVKCVMTSIGVIVLSCLSYERMAKLATQALSVFYTCLMCLHLKLFIGFN